VPHDGRARKEQREGERGGDPGERHGGRALSLCPPVLCRTIAASCPPLK
jgi:hypothetical protein